MKNEFRLTRGHRPTVETVETCHQNSTRFFPTPSSPPLSRHHIRTPLFASFSPSFVKSIDTPARAPKSRPVDELILIYRANFYDLYSSRPRSTRHPNPPLDSREAYPNVWRDGGKFGRACIDSIFVQIASIGR